MFLPEGKVIMAITLDKAASGNMTLEEFFNYDDGTDALYEFEDGELLLMTAESEINRRIAMFILVCFVQLGIPVECRRAGRMGLVDERISGVCLLVVGI